MEGSRVLRRVFEFEVEGQRKVERDMEEVDGGGMHTSAHC